MILQRSLYWNSDRTHVVEEGDVRAAFLYGRPGTVVDDEEAKRLGILEEAPAPKPEPKVEAKPEPKPAPKPAPKPEPKPKPEQKALLDPPQDKAVKAPPAVKVRKRPVVRKGTKR